MTHTLEEIKNIVHVDFVFTGYVYKSADEIDRYIDLTAEVFGHKETIRIFDDGSQDFDQCFYEIQRKTSNE